MKTYRFVLLSLCALAPAAQGQFNYISNNNAAIITGYTGPGGAVSIPSTLGGLPVTVIEGSGFEDKGITTVSIPASVTNIAEQEFAPNDSLTNITVDTNSTAYSSAGGVLFNKTGATLVEYPPGVTGSFSIPGTVTTIGDSAFAACYFLSGVTILGSVTNIGATAFGYCFDLTNITIPSSVTSIGPDVFINCYSLPAISVAAGNSFFTSVGGVLFDKNETTLLDFPTGSNGSYTIPNGVTTIGTNAFILCDGITNIAMQASVENIDDGAFGDCAGLTSITLGAGVNYVSTFAFGGAVNLAAINVNSGNPNLSSISGVVFDKNQATLIKFPPGLAGVYTIPNTVTSVADDAFEDCAVNGVIIPGTVASLGLDSFQGCGSLTNVTMSNGVSSIGIFAFADCPQLATVTIPATVTSLPYGAFAYDDFGSVYFEGNAPGGDPSAFLGDSGTIYYMAGTSGWGSSFEGLSTVIEGEPNPNGAFEVTILPAGAALAGAEWEIDGGVAQPSGATAVGLAVGSHTLSFTTISGWVAPSNQTVSVTGNVTNTASGTYTEEAAPGTDFVIVTNGGSITITGYVGPGGAVLIPATINGLPVTALGDSAFSGINTLTSVVIPDSVTNFGNNIFSSCANLAQVTISAGVSDVAFGTFEDCFSLNSVTFRGALSNIDEFSFASCPDLQSLAIQEGVTNIGEYAFFESGLTNVTIPASVTNIGEAAFVGCTALPSIAVDPANPAYTSAAGVLLDKNETVLVQYPDGNPQTSYAVSNTVTSIADYAFQDCALTSIILPNGLTSIGNYSFDSCDSLVNITIPTNVVSIGDDAFALSTSLTSIALPASLTSLGSAPFSGCTSMDTITAALANPVFSSFNGVLYNKTGTVLVAYPGGPTGTFTVPSGTQDIGLEAFENCQIGEVVIPASVTNLEDFAFSGCSRLGRVLMSEGVQAIGVAAFQNCYELTNLTLSPSLTNIGYAAFSDCSALTTVIIPSSVSSLGDYAFGFYSGITAAYFEGNAPPDDSTVFAYDNNATVYYLPGATGWSSTFGTAPTVMLAGITAAANPTNGAAPLVVNFTAAALTSASNVVTNWNWNFGDGATSTAQNPSHTYTSLELFSASVVETNGAGLPVAGRVVSILVTFQESPEITEISVVGTNLVLDGTGGQAGTAYVVLSSTNLNLPLSQWTPAATNTPGVSGNFSITVSNAVSTTVSQRYFILQIQ